MNHAATLRSPGSLSAELKARNVLWYQSMLAMCALFVFCTLASLVDDRTLLDISVWIKPAKFSLSIAVYFATLLWFVPLLPDGYFQSRRGRILSLTPVVCTIGEMTYITLQAARGEASHFNTAEPLYAFFYGLMGTGAVLMVTVCLAMAAEIFHRHRLRDPFAFAVTLGLLGTFVFGGGFGAYLGSSPTGHWVDAPSTDANGLFGFNWTREGGDLRVAHFFGMHAMQVLPLLALLIPAGWRVLNANLLLLSAFVAYGALTTATFIQAINGQPFLG